MTADHEKLLNALLVQLNLQRAGLRKRAIQCLGNWLIHVHAVIPSAKEIGCYLPCYELHSLEQLVIRWCLCA